jgi:hypothetical protein
MKTKHFIFGLALGLGLMATFGFQNRENEASGETMMIKAFHRGSISIAAAIEVISPDGSFESEKFTKEKGSSIESNEQLRDMQAIIALNKYKKEGFSVKTAVASTGGGEITYILER